MTTTRRGLFVMRTSDDGTECAAECPFLDVSWDVCRATDRTLTFDMDEGVYERHVACIAAETAAREAEAEALQRGYDIADSDFEVSETDGWVRTAPFIERCLAARSLAKEIERIRGGGQ